MNDVLFTIAKIPFIKEAFQWLVSALSYGTIGLAFVMGFLIQRLLSQAQKKEGKADPLVISSLNRFMLFAFGICVLGMIVQIIPVIWPAKAEVAKDTDYVQYVRDHPDKFKSVFKELFPPPMPDEVDCKVDCPCPPCPDPVPAAQCTCDTCEALNCPLTNIKPESQDSSGCIDKRSIAPKEKVEPDSLYAKLNLYKHSTIYYCSGDVSTSASCQTPKNSSCQPHSGRVLGRSFPVRVRTQTPFIATNPEDGEWITLEKYINDQAVSVLVCPKIDQEPVGRGTEEFIYAHVVAGRPDQSISCDSFYNTDHRIRKWTYKAFPVRSGEYTIHVGLESIDLSAGVGDKFVDVVVWPQSKN